MSKIEDLSFSNLVSIIQKDEKTAGTCLNDLAFEKEELDESIQNAELKLDIMKSRRKSIIEASHNIAKHLGKSLPLAVKRNNYIIVVSNTCISIERNVI